jgi:hypothetical protein
MKLNAYKEWVIWGLDDFNEAIVWRCASDD